MYVSLPINAFMMKSLHFLAFHGKDEETRKGEKKSIFLHNSFLYGK